MDYSIKDKPVIPDLQINIDGFPYPVMLAEFVENIKKHNAMYLRLLSDLSKVEQIG